MAINDNFNFYRRSAFNEATSRFLVGLAISLLAVLVGLLYWIGLSLILLRGEP